MDRILILTADADLLDDLLRVAAAAGAEADVCGDPAHVRARWRLAPAVVVGTDLLAAAGRLALPRRDRVVVVGPGPPEPARWQQAVEVGAARVLGLPADEAALLAVLAGAHESGTTGHLIAVVGGCGGAGASVLVAALAVAAAGGGTSVLALDLDPAGGGLDLLFGAEALPGLRWPDLSAAAGRLSPSALRRALPVAHGVAVLAHDRGRPATPGTEAVLALVAAGRAAGGRVVADLPRTWGPVHDAVLGAADAVFVVVPATVRAVAAAATTCAAVAAVTPLAGLVVRRGPVARLPAADVSTALDLPLAAVLANDPRLPAQLDDGAPPGVSGRGPTAAAARALLRELTPDSARRRSA